MATKTPQINLLKERAKKVHKEKDFFVRVKSSVIIGLIIYLVFGAGIMALGLISSQRLKAVETAIKREGKVIEGYRDREARQALIQEKASYLVEFFEKEDLIKASLLALYDLFTDDSYLTGVSFADDGTLRISGETESIFAFELFYMRLMNYVKDDGVKSVTLSQISRGPDGVYSFSGDVLLNMNGISGNMEE